MTTLTSLDALLRQVGDAWSSPDQARGLIERALAEYPDEEEAFVAAYRYYFYRNDLPSALGIAEQCLSRIQHELALPPDWRQLEPGTIDFADPGLPRHRFLLFALNAYAYLLARLGRHADADQAFAVVSRLDPADKVGAARLQSVLRRGPDADEDMGAN